MTTQSLHALEDTKCVQCRQEIAEGDPVYNIMLDFYENDDIRFAICCSMKCVEHTIEDHGAELELHSRHAGR